MRAVLLTGAGRGFCAGQDLSERNVSAGAAPIDLSVTLGSNYNPLVRRMRELPKPIVCAVNGVAAGAGANIALACDIVLAARSASFVQSFSQHRPGARFGRHLFPAAPRRHARAPWASRCSPTSSRAEDAERWGLIWKAVDDARSMQEASAIARTLADGADQGLRPDQEGAHASAGNTLDAQLDLERDLQREAGVSEDYREGVAAFMQKRKPVFKGK